MEPETVPAAPPPAPAAPAATDTAPGETAPPQSPSPETTPPNEPQPHHAQAAESEPAPPAKKTVSGDDLYRRSSQYREWSFAAAELVQRKQQANEKGRLAAEKRFAEAREALLAEKPAVFAAHADALSAPELVSFADEQKYLHFFGQQIVQICAHFNMPSQVRATAIAFFKRFYLVNSVMEYRPRNILYTAVFLAAKSENYFIGIDTFCARIPKTSAKDILDLEFVVLQALGFTLLVHHPFRPLYGFFLDFQSVLLHPHPVMYDVSIDTIGQLHDKAKRWLNDHALLSDAALLFTPPQIALAALYDADKRVTDRYLRRKFLGPDESDTAPGARDYDHLVRTVRRCVQRARSEPETSREESTRIDERCFFSLHPAKLLKKRIKALGS